YLLVGSDDADGTGPVGRPVDLRDDRRAAIAEPDTDRVAILAQMTTGLDAGIQETLVVVGRAEHDRERHHRLTGCLWLRRDIGRRWDTSLYIFGFLRLFTFRFLGNRLASLAAVPRRIELTDQAVFEARGQINLEIGVA